MDEENNHPAELADAVFAIGSDDHFYLVGERIDARHVANECNRRGAALDDARARISELEAELADRVPLPADLPSDESLAERLHDAYRATWPEDQRGPSWDELPCDSIQRKGRMAQARAVLELLRPWLAGRKTDAVPDLPSDEALAERLHEVYRSSWTSWEKLNETPRAARIAQARAAKAMLAPWLQEQTPCPTCERVRKALEDEG